MNPQDITFVFENGKAYAIHEGKVVDSDLDVDALETRIAGPHKDDCTCGFCANKGSFGKKDDSEDSEENDADESEDTDKKTASVITPNGLRGTILGKVASNFGGEVAVRLENGRIIHIEAHAIKTLRTASTKKKINPVVDLESRVASTVDGSYSALSSRVDELEAITREASALIRQGTSDAEAERLHHVVVTASLEADEIAAVLAHLDDEATQRIAAPAPYRVQVVEQEGRGGDWLDAVTNDMIADAETTDFEKLMDEGPEALTAELPDVAIADQGAVQSIASSYVSEKTAGTDPAIRERYMNTFIARVEECRRTELAARKQTQHKEAAVEEDKFKDLPDSMLFS